MSRLATLTSGMLVLLLQVEYQMTLSSARALWGCALGGPAKGRPALHERTRAPAPPPCLGCRPMQRPPAGGIPPPVGKGDRSLSPSNVCLFFSPLVCLHALFCVLPSSFAFGVVVLSALGSNVRLGLSCICALSRRSVEFELELWCELELVCVRVKGHERLELRQCVFAYMLFPLREGSLRLEH